MAKKGMGGSAPAGPRRLGWHSVARLTLYYLVAGGMLLLLTALFPQHPLKLDGAAPTGMTEGLAWMRRQLAIVPEGAPRWVDAAVQMVGALLLVLPIAFTYIRTRTRLKYDRSLIQTVIVLPIVVTAILVVVQDSLALAFSLAGIVAAVRFRNNLRESGDAVYIFGSIGIGFATGIHALGVATVLSLFFVLLELALWKFNLSEEFDETFRRVCMPSGAGLSAPPPSAGDVPAPQPGNDRKRSAEGLESDSRAVVLRIYVDQAGVARPAVERVLTRDTKQWSAVGVEGAEGGSGVLEYRLRHRKSVGLETLRENLLTEGAPYVIAADEAGPI
jgi:uncharacterized protein DUF4956